MNFCSHSRKLYQNEQIKSRKNFPVNLSPDKPETGFLFFRVVGEILFFLFSLSECTFSPQERKVSRSKQNMSFLCENHFQPANPESLTTPDSPIRSLVVIVLKLKSQLSSFENLRGIVRPKKLSEVKSLSKPQSLSMSKKRTVPQRFFNTNLSLFSFPTMPANDRGYGHGRFAGEFPVVQRQGKCGRKTCKVHVSQPVNIGVC